MDYDKPPVEIVEQAEQIDRIATCPKLLDALQRPEFDLGLCELVSVLPGKRFYRSKSNGYLYFEFKGGLRGK